MPDHLFCEIIGTWLSLSYPSVRCYKMGLIDPALCYTSYIYHLSLTSYKPRRLTFFLLPPPAATAPILALMLLFLRPICGRGMCVTTFPILALTPSTGILRVRSFLVAADVPLPPKTLLNTSSVSCFRRSVGFEKDQAIETWKAAPTAAVDASSAHLYN